MKGVGGRLGREVEVERHFAVCGAGIVRAFEELAAEGRDGCFGRDCHCRWSRTVCGWRDE